MFWDLLLGFLMQFAPLSGGLGFASDATPVPGTPAVPAAAVDSTTSHSWSGLQAPFRVRFGDEVSAFPVMAMFVLPGETVPLSVEPGLDTAPTAYAASASTGTLSTTDDRHWTWTAPEQSGLQRVEVQAATGEAMTLNVFVMVPYDQIRNGSLRGYRIGTYPATRKGYESAYQRPAGFIEVTPELLDVQVSPHFQIRQFLCKQGTAYPKYLVLQEPLLVQLEKVLEAVHERGIEAPTFSVMSAYRTPSYNAAIGNVTTFSRHHYGDAADIFIDVDHDGVMDDLNRDGRHTMKDAKVLADIVKAVKNDTKFEGRPGGLGAYGPSHTHGPFVHVDVRGFEASWGGA